MYNCNRLHAWWSTQSWLTTLLSSLIARRWVRLQTLWRFRFKDLSIYEMVGAWCFGCLSGPAGFSCWISFAQYSVLFTVESLPLLYLHLYLYLYVLIGDALISLGSFMQTKYLCVLVHIWIKGLFICPLWSPAGKGLTSWLSFVVSNCEFVTFPLVSWVRFGTCLYGYLIFAPLLTLNVSELNCETKRINCTNMLIF